MPPEIEKIVEDNLRKLQYAAPIQDGKPVAGVTYALQEACAAPVDGKYGFAVKYLGNGPSMDRRSFPFYPREMQRRGIESKWTVEYSVAPDGKGGVVAMTRECAKSLLSSVREQTKTQPTSRGPTMCRSTAGRSAASCHRAT